MKKSRLLLVLLTLILTVIVLVGCDTSAESSYLIIEINPAVEMVLNENDEVEYVNSLNADGDVLLSQLDLEGMEVEEAIDEIIDESTELGFIDPEAEETVVDVTTVTEEDEEVFESRIRQHFDNAFIERGMHGYAKMGKMTPEIIAEAEELGIGAGTLRLIKQAQVLDPTLTLEAALEMSVSELISLVKQNGLNEMVVALREKFFADRDVIIAKYQPQIDALTTQIASELDETVKADLEVQLEEVYKALQAEVKVLRDQFQTEAAVYRDQMRLDNQQRRADHRAQMDQYRQSFKEHTDEMRESARQWRNGKNK